MPYWGPAEGAPVAGVGGAAREPDESVVRSEPGPAADPRLRRLRQLRDVAVMAVDGKAGKVTDAVADTEDWIIRKLVVKTRKWLPGGEVLVPLVWISCVDWAKAEAHTSLTRKLVRQCQDYDPELR
jgi:hypothetical protein